MKSLTSVKILGLGALVLTTLSSCGATPYMIAASPTALAALGTGIGINAVAAASRPSGERYEGSNVTQIIMDRIFNGPPKPKAVSVSPGQQVQVEECIIKNGEKSCTTRIITTTAVPTASVLETGRSLQSQTVSVVQDGQRVESSKPPPTGPACLQTGKCKPIP